MDPINQKEITSSFIQFMVLFLITVILAIVCVFFDQKFSQDSYKALKEDYKELKKNSQNDFVAEFLQIMDSTQNNIRNLDKIDANNFDALRIDLNDRYLDRLKAISSSDTTDSDKLKMRVRSICNDWVNDKRQLIKINDFDKKLISKDKKIDKLESMLMQMGVKDDVIKNIGE